MLRWMMSKAISTTTLGSTAIACVPSVPARCARTRRHLGDLGVRQTRVRLADDQQPLAVARAHGERVVGEHGVALAVTPLDADDDGVDRRKLALELQPELPARPGMYGASTRLKTSPSLPRARAAANDVRTAAGSGGAESGTAEATSTGAPARRASSVCGGPRAARRRCRSAPSASKSKATKATGVRSRSVSSTSLRCNRVCR